MWEEQWISLYEPDDQKVKETESSHAVTTGKKSSVEILTYIKNNYHLVNLVDNQYPKGNCLFEVLREVTSRLRDSSENVGSSDAEANITVCEEVNTDNQQSLTPDRMTPVPVFGLTTEEAAEEVESKMEKTPIQQLLQSVSQISVASNDDGRPDGATTSFPPFSAVTERLCPGSSSS